MGDLDSSDSESLPSVPWGEGPALPPSLDMSDAVSSADAVSSVSVSSPCSDGDISVVLDDRSAPSVDSFEVDVDEPWPCPYPGCVYEGRSLHALKSHHHRRHAFLLDVKQVHGRGNIIAAAEEEAAKVGAAMVDAQVCVDGVVLEQVPSFPYLGSVVTEDGGAEEEVKARIKKAGAAFGVLKRPLWAHEDVSLKRKGQVYNAAVLSTLLYGAETWSVSSAGMRRLEAFHQRCLRSIAHMPQIRHHTNAAVLKAMGSRRLRDVVQERRLRWFGHVRRMEKRRWPARMLGAVLPEKRRSGAQRVTWEALVREDCKGLECADPWAQCLDRVAWRTTCGRKLRNGQ